jgi:hypothetical protein
MLSSFTIFYDMRLEVGAPVSRLCLVVSFHVNSVESYGSFHNYFTLHKFKYFSG